MYSAKPFQENLIAANIANADYVEEILMSQKVTESERKNYAGKIIIKVPNAVSKLAMEKAHQEIDSLPTCKFLNNGNQMQRVNIRAENVNRVFSTVTFDENGKLSGTEGFDQNFAPHTESINEMCKEALQSMGRQLNWKNFTVKVHCGVLRYIFTPAQQEICNMPWHKDASSLSMTTLLSPYIQQNNGFSGGALSFAEESDTKCVPVGKTIKTVEYEKPGDSIIFNGLHKVEDMHVSDVDELTKRPVERRLLTCCAELTEDYVRNLIATLGEENLA
ncbi:MULTISPECIES: hypothetical protein [unclassified Endozoicomonas]|uniref:hypothetical protein n=1 Tax=unclassified Endozoicomonas TaxID=2644528 RepID=UPI003BB742FB